MKRLAVLVAAAFAILSAPAFADERLTNYASDIVVAQTGALTVTETISVISEGEKSATESFAFFPRIIMIVRGHRVHVGFDVLSATRDGHAEPYSVDSVDDGMRIKIGSPDVLIEPGAHTYTLTYATNRQIGFFADYDELYWNVTGNLWKFPIDHAEATIKLPYGAKTKQSAFYTGGTGSTARNARAEKLTEREIRFETTAPLGVEEGLTIAIGFSKGAVIPPSKAELREQFIRDNGSTMTAVAGVVILLIYFVVVWWTHGRDPKRGVVIPLFAPPQGFSPAAVRFVHRMAYDRKSYAASLVDMAVKGYLKISEEHGTYTLTRTGKSEGEAGLAHGEVAIANKLFSSGDDSIALKQDNHSEIAASISALKSSLANEYEKIYFNTNSPWFFGGLAMLGVAAVATALLCDNAAVACFILIWLSGWSIGTSFLLHRVYDNWLSVVAGPGSRFINTLGALFMTAFAIPFTGGLIFGIFILAQAIALPASLALVAGGILSYVFYTLLKAPTLAGAKIFDQIDGFRLFLVTAEKDRLEALNPPQVTPEMFEKFLPYAIALDCENQWSRKFEVEAAAAGRAPDSNYGYSPIWYSGSSFSRLGAVGFSSALGASMASSAASAATAPGSSSGSGGGGFSGGGGGGGGGGGW